MSAIQTNADIPLAHHIKEKHQGNAKALSFWGITQIKFGSRSGNLDCLLFQEEANGYID